MDLVPGTLVEAILGERFGCKYEGGEGRWVGSNKQVELNYSLRLSFLWRERWAGGRVEQTSLLQSWTQRNVLHCQGRLSLPQRCSVPLTLLTTNQPSSEHWLPWPPACWGLRVGGSYSPLPRTIHCPPCPPHPATKGLLRGLSKRGRSAVSRTFPLRSSLPGSHRVPTEATPSPGRWAGDSWLPLVLRH